jgi:hypothetical protein
MQLLLIYNRAQTYKNGKYTTLSVQGYYAILTPYTKTNWHSGLRDYVGSESYTAIGGNCLNMNFIRKLWWGEGVDKRKVTATRRFKTAMVTFNNYMEVNVSRYIIHFLHSLPFRYKMTAKVLRHKYKRKSRPYENEMCGSLLIKLFIRPSNTIHWLANVCSGHQNGLLLSDN